MQRLAGKHDEHDGQLEMAGVGKGGVTLPLALDGHPKRIDLPADWGRLIVTKNRRTVGAHEANGFRIRVGEHQGQIYRSLIKPTISRAVRGWHPWVETMGENVVTGSDASRPGINWATGDGRQSRIFFSHAICRDNMS
jgi:hypothetical protein